MSNTELHNHLNEWYEENMYDPYVQELCGGDDFFNFGYWHESTTDVRVAQRNLLSLLARPFRNEGSMLDVACGKGATTNFIAKTFPDASVTGIDISEKHIQSCMVNAPDCQFEVMDAVATTFESSSFDAIISVEAAFHFDSRRAFLAEAFRILKPGGWLALADILMEVRDDEYLASIGVYPDDPQQPSPTPSENTIKSIDDYEQALVSAGFCDIDIVDVTVECTDRFIAHARRFATEKRAHHEISQEKYNEKEQALDWLVKVCRPYIRVHARKPSSP